jgi:uncharacterized membrane protein
MLLWAVRILSFAAMTVCFVLFGMKLNGSITSLAGCGSEGGCAQVLGSRWSEWFHVPVTLWAGLLYLGVVLLTVPGIHRALGHTGDQLLAAAGVIMAGAAIYFLSLMAWIYRTEGVHCPWCLALHVTGLTVAGILLFSAVRTQREDGRGLLSAAALSGAAAIGVLAAGQVWGPRPQTHLITSGGLREDAAAPRPAAAPAPGDRPSRMVSFFDGRMSFDAAALPILGSPDAKVILVEFFDYTCKSCRLMSGDLKALRQRWPGVFSVVVLPTPLHRNCNPFLRPNVSDHPGACELAHLALAVWHIRPERFPDFHEYLMALSLPVLPAAVSEAKTKAVSLAGTAVLAAIEDPAVKGQITENLGNFARLTAESIVMPKLLLHASTMMHGPAADTDSFLREMEDRFKPGAPATPVISRPK